MPQLCSRYLSRKSARAAVVFHCVASAGFRGRFLLLLARAVSQRSFLEGGQPAPEQVERARRSYAAGTKAEKAHVPQLCTVLLQDAANCSAVGPG